MYADLVSYEPTPLGADGESK